MKKILIMILMMLLLVSLVGCGAKKKMEEKIGEAITEKMFEEAGGGDIDIDGDEITITTEDGDTATFGKTEWPTSDLAKSIPKLGSGNVISVMEMDDYVLISLEETPEKEFTDYLDEIKDTFTEDSYDIKSEGYVSYGGGNGEGVTVTIIYGADETLSITIVKVAE
ncbi:MAG: hypothetical protein GX915_02420 [Clostridiales bacterium]|nr:hypothetical protein [Clostridiales bacterium]